MIKHALVVAIFFSLSAGWPCWGYDLRTHAVISRAAAAASSLPSALAALQLTAGSRLDAAAAGTEFNDGTANGWIEEGAVREDGESVCDDRVRNHFYNPIDNHGYSAFGFLTGFPSASWGLEEDASYPAQDHSYQDARSYFWSALRPNADAERQHNLALTFRSLGQIIHLIQDAAQPQHTRNDSHAGLRCPYTLGLLGPTSLYEEYVEGRAITNKIVFSGYPNVTFPRPRDYWDAEDGSGIAEFSNRNFVSEATNFSGSLDNLQPAPGFPSPTGGGTRIVSEDVQALLPGTTLSGRLKFIGIPYDDLYLGVGGFNPRASAYSVFDADLARRGLTPIYTLNRFTFEEAEKILIPRAVGYSAGLIDHFFRGRIDIAAPDKHAYAVTPYAAGQGEFSRMEMKVRNATPGEQTGIGTIQAIVRYRTEYNVDPLLYPGYTLGGPASYAVSTPQQIALTDDFQPLSFDFREDPIPAKITDVSLVVAFRGPLIGSDSTEPEGILVGGKDLYEPDYFVVGNSMDYDCFGDVLYDTVGLALPQRDLDGDGRQDLFGPWRLAGNYQRVSASPYTVASSSDFNFQVPELASAQYAGFVLLQDQRFFWLSLTVEDALETSLGTHRGLASRVQYPATINRFVEENGKLIHEVSAYNAVFFRGVYAPHHAHWVNAPVRQSDACLSAIQTAPRLLAEVAGSTAPEYQ
jgi:hypothetical protein